MGEVRRLNDARSGEDPTRATLTRWGVAALIAVAALIGGGALAIVFFATLDLPGWAQYVIGFGLPIGAAVLAWLIASALTSASRNRS